MAADVVELRGLDERVVGVTLRYDRCHEIAEASALKPTEQAWLVFRPLVDLAHLRLSLSARIAATRWISSILIELPT